MRSQASGHAGLFQVIGAAWSRYRRRRAALAELQALDGAERDRLVRDSGLTFGDLAALANRPDSAELLPRRLGASGIDVPAIELSVLRDMQRCCSLCDSKAQCAHELEDKPQPASWPAYCPNSMTISALSASKCC